MGVFTRGTSEVGKPEMAQEAQLRMLEQLLANQGQGQAVEEEEDQDELTKQVKKQWKAFVDDKPRVPNYLHLAKTMGFFLGGIVLMRTFGQDLDLEAAL